MKRTILATSVCLAMCSASATLAQSYNGVVPGSDAVPEGIAGTPGDTPLVTWPGFQMQPDGGSRVFVQTSIEVKPELKRDGANWQVVIPGVALPQGNARLALDTEYFNTPVKNVRVKVQKDGVSVLLEMRAQLTPKLRTEKAPNGYFFTYIEFPAGSFNR